MRGRRVKDAAPYRRAAGWHFVGRDDPARPANPYGSVYRGGLWPPDSEISRKGGPPMLPYTHGGDVLTAQARYGGPVLDCSANLNSLGMPPQVGDSICRAYTSLMPG